MTIDHALRYAVKIVEWISPYCTVGSAPPHGASIATAGSIRRDRPECGDVDIVCIPKLKEERDMLGAVIHRENLLFSFIKAHARSGAARITSGGETEGKQMIVELKKCQLDLWFADEKNFASRLLCRTGSKDHNVWIATRCKRMNLKWNTYEGILSGGTFWPGDSARSDEYVGGKLEQFATEAEFYARLGLPFIEPKNRELDYLVKNFGQ
ncbi:MAG TPA: hypothetical protein VGY56_10510 [Verrucomicrobiae bacterium]|nr:hypothetical protein [Verrucomicrobiae bacterium]